MLKIHAIQNNTWIRCTAESYFHKYRKGDKVLFMGWITNYKSTEGNSVSGEALIWDESVLNTININEEGWEFV